MKITKIITLMVGLIPVAAFAVDIPVEKGATNLVYVFDGKFTAELKITGSETLKIDAARVTRRSNPKGEVYNYSGRANLEVIADGKSVLTLSGENIQVETPKANAAKK